MKKISFGLAQLTQDVPGEIKTIYRVSMFCTGFFALVQGQFPIPPALVAHIDHLLAFGVSFIYYLCQFFGYDKPGQEQPNKMPAFDVPAIPAPPANVEDAPKMGVPGPDESVPPTPAVPQEHPTQYS